MGHRQKMARTRNPEVVRWKYGKYGDEIWGQTESFIMFLFARIKIEGTVPSVPSSPYTSLAFLEGCCGSEIERFRTKAKAGRNA
jgi:hypothetical protein